CLLKPRLDQWIGPHMSGVRGAGAIVGVPGAGEFVTVADVAAVVADLAGAFVGGVGNGGWSGAAGDAIAGEPGGAAAAVSACGVGAGGGEALWDEGAD